MGSFEKIYKMKLKFLIISGGLVDIWPMSCENNNKTVNLTKEKQWPSWWFMK